MLVEENLYMKAILIVLVDKVDDDFDHGVLFFGAAFGDH